MLGLSVFSISAKADETPIDPVDTTQEETSVTEVIPKIYQSGIASWYGHQFNGRKTANGERFDMNAMTAAHKSLPLNCHLRVTNKNNGESVIVKVNDRGPYVSNRIIDLSYAAAQKLGFVGQGTAQVTIEVIH
jgi:rare lipoprotein A